MDEPLPAFTRNEVWCYLRVTPCPSCGHGPWEVQREDADGRALALLCRCRKCGREMRLDFTAACDQPDAGAAAEVLNPTDEPSRIIDLAQWVGLFHRLVEQAARDASKTHARRAGLQAALCLAEALKFHVAGQDEPPETAFFNETTRRAFREHPERFSHSRLRELQGRLPALHVMAAHVDRDERRGRRRWWQFWRR
jgi:hypothetical protein